LAQELPALGYEAPYQYTHWFDVIESEELETESYVALAPFREPEIIPFLAEEAQQDLEYLADQDEEASCI
jgi:hypothetical protein